MKSGAGHVTQPGLAGVVIGMLTDPRLFTGYALYALSTLLLILALKDGELSLLYPVIALTYVWVTALSFILFRETVNPHKIAGIAIIVAGVVVLGRSNGS
ncbi:MAG: EamA family transporter [Bryobacteraceae bacterium]